jgi:hypothetical protein
MFVELAQADQELREQLIREGTLFGGYNSEMEAMHNEHGGILSEYLVANGWPEEKLESDAAWLILMHSISLPTLQRSALQLLQTSNSFITKAQLATLEDRVLVNSGKKQKYGTQWDWDATGKLNPLPIEDSTSVNALRQRVGLNTLEERGNELRTHADEEGERAPKDRPAYLRSRHEWMLRVGWIDSLDEIDPAFLN